jgi:hypothetical protein
VLAGHAHAFLGIGCTGIGAFVGTQEYILELDHAGIGEQQSLVSARDKGRRRHKGVPVFHKEIDKILADLGCSSFSNSHNCS